MAVSDEVRIGAELLGYRVEELVGRGGMSVVYRATELRLRRPVALKLLAPELAEDEGFRRRFLAESELAASLDHPHILPVFAAGEANGLLYIAMRYVEDGDLRHLLRAQGTLEPARAVALLADVADALDAAHARGLVHRDVKPSNILIGVRGDAEHAYLADFGLTRRTGEHSGHGAAARISGTVDYVAPEQLARDESNVRTDVYSLGCVLYECLTGEAPFQRDSELAVLWAHMRADPPRVTDRSPALPRAIDSVVAKALAKDPAKRYGTCRELVDAARVALGLSAAPAARPRTALAIAAAGLVAAAAVAGAFALGGTDRSPLALRGNSLVRIDPSTNTVSAVIDVGEKPVSVAVWGETVWVYNLGDGTVSQIDARTNDVRRTTRITTYPYTAKDHVGPLLAANSAGAWLVGLHEDGSGIVTWIARDGRKRETRVEPSALAIAANETGVWVLASHIPSGRCPLSSDAPLPPSISDAAVRLSPKTGRVVARVPLPACGEINGIGADARWTWLFASWYSRLFRIDARSSRLDASTVLGPGGDTQGGGVPESGGGSVWLHASDRGGRIVGLDRATLRTTTTITAVPGRFGALRYSEGAVWWNDPRGGVVLRFDADTGKLDSTVRTVPESGNFHSSSIATGAGSVWVTVTPAFLP